MRNKHLLLIAVLLLTVCTEARAQTQTPTEVTLMRNSDVVRMVEDGLKSGVIMSKILTSHCNFDLFPPVLRDLKRRVVPDTVLMAMKMAPSGPPPLGEADSKTKVPISPLQLPEATVLELATN